MLKQIKTTKDRIHNIETDDAEIVDWFDRPDVTMTDCILDQLNNERLYDPVLANKENLIMLDVGANIGLFSLYAQDSAKQIICLEPTPNTLGILEKLTAGIDCIKIAPVALSDSDGEIIFYINENPTINSVVNQVGTEVRVQARTIETVLREQALEWVDFVKCDIEGSEMLAITEATIDPVKDQIGSWFIEVHQTNGNTGAPWPGNLEDNRQQLLAVLRNAGYSAEPIIHDQIFAWK
jgi:FkbM family methyltransferase